MTVELNFVRQQGFRDASAATCPYQYPALMWQPRMIGILVLVGVVLQWWLYFLGLSAILWWNVVLPQLNPFDGLYSVLVAGPKARPRVGAAPAPRRFAQAMAGTLMLATALSLRVQWVTTAWIIEGVLLAALAALILGRFCLGSYLFLLVTGDGRFAKLTLPWGRGG